MNGELDDMDIWTRKTFSTVLTKVDKRTVETPILHLFCPFCGVEYNNTSKQKAKFVNKDLGYKHD